MDSLPLEISLSILSKLSTLSLACFKCVCKAWYDLASHPDIATLPKNPCFVLHSNKIPDQLCMVDDNDLCKTDRKDASRVTLTTKFKVPFISAGYRIDSLLSCNGLLLISYSMRKDREYIQKVSIYNPLIDKFRTLPDSNPELFGQEFKSCYGFGFEPIAKQYKVIKVVQYNKKQLFYSFTLGISEDWRKHVFNQKSVSIEIEQYGVYVDGTLNWKSNHWNGYYFDNRIVSFDVFDETFRSFSGQATEGSYYLGVHKGSLSAFQWDHDKLFIYNLSKRRGRLSWVYKYCMACPCSSVAMLSLQYGKMFLVRKHDEIGDCFETIDYYDPITGSYGYLLMKDLSFCPERGTTLVPSLVWPFVESV